MDTVTLRPSANGAVNAWGYQYPASGSHWDKVDEAVADDATTYLYYGSVTANKTELFVHAGYVGAGEINAVRVYYRIKSLGVDTTYYQAVVKTHGVNYYETVQSRTGAFDWTTYYKEWTVCPATGLPWTWDEINQLQFGITTKASAGGVKHFTQCYVEVDHTISVTGGTNVGIGGCGGSGMMF